LRVYYIRRVSHSYLSPAHILVVVPAITGRRAWCRYRG
jgi:hypothetical protein